jgi:hypothetical protein
MLERALSLAEKFNGTLHLFYIIEDKTLQKTDKISNSHLTYYSKLETNKDIIRENKFKADNVIFDEINYYLKKGGISYTEKIVKGEFSSIVKDEVENGNYDLVLMSYEKGCLLNYRLIDDLSIPIWVESEIKCDSILGILSNLSPNQRVPDFSIKLSKIFNWNLHMLYIIDIADSVQVDENGFRSNNLSERDLVFNAENFIKNIGEFGIDIKLIKGNLEKETIREAKKMQANLIVIGREQKKRNMIGLPVKRLKKKIMQKCDYSILFLN